MNTVLVIDDNADYRENLIEILGFEPYETLEAEDGQVGLQMIFQHSPNLIICDVDMPIMNGIEVLRMVKADPIAARIPFLMITGNCDEHTLRTSCDLGVEAFLKKPIAIEEFLSTIGHFLTEDILNTSS